MQELRSWRRHYLAMMHCCTASQQVCQQGAAALLWTRVKPSGQTICTCRRAWQCFHCRHDNSVLLREWDVYQWHTPSRTCQWMDLRITKSSVAGVQQHRLWENSQHCWGASPVHSIDA